MIEDKLKDLEDSLNSKLKWMLNNEFFSKSQLLKVSAFFKLKGEIKQLRKLYEVADEHTQHIIEQEVLLKTNFLESYK